eukprot:XP_001703509.1 predicted protein [Chlamydomonas reinhardtii]
MPQETAAAATAARRGEQQLQSQDDTEGPRQHAAPQVSCPVPGGVAPIVVTPFAALASAPLSCPGASSAAADCGIPSASAARAACERRRSISECGGTALSFQGADTQHRVRDTDGGAGAGSVHPDVDDLCSRFKSSCGAGDINRAVAQGAAAPRPCARTDQQPQASKRRWLPSGACHVPPLPARAAGVNVDGNAAAGGSSVSSSLDLSADFSGASAKCCGRPAGYVKATAREYALRQAKVITCLITPFPSPRQQLRKAKSPPQAK